MYRLKIFLFCIVSLVVFNACTSSDKNKISYRNVHTSQVFNDSLLAYTTVENVVKVENIKTDKVVFWEKLTDENWSQPIIDKQNTIYYASSVNTFQCRNVDTKKQVWILKTGDEVRDFKLVNDSTIVFSSRDFGLKAVDSKTGKIRYEIEDLNDNNPCLATTLIYHFSFDETNFYANDLNCNNVIAYRSADGKKVWEFNAEVEGTTASLRHDNYIFCGITGDPLKNEGEIYLLDSKNGKVLFSKKTPFDLIVHPIAYKNKIIYYTYDYKLNILDLDTLKTAVLCEFKQEQGVRSQLFLIGDTVYFEDFSLAITRLNLKTGTKQKIGNSPRGLSDVYKIGNKIKFVY